LSSEEKGDPATLQFVQDEDKCVISSPDGVLINVLKSPHDLLLAVADALPKDASSISDLVGATPLPLINSVKGMVLEVGPDPFPDWVKRPSDASISIFGADALEFGLYLIQHRTGSAVTTLEVGDTDLGSEKELVTAQIDAEHISLVDGGLPSGELATGIVINGESFPIDELQFYNESLKSYLVVISKALGTMFAQLIFKPASRRAEQKEQIQKFKNQLIADGFLLLLSRANSVEIQDHLNSYLDPAIHFDIAQAS
jgi:hypothetical protein